MKPFYFLHFLKINTVDDCHVMIHNLVHIFKVWLKFFNCITESLFFFTVSGLNKIFLLTNNGYDRNHHYSMNII